MMGAGAMRSRWLSTALTALLLGCSTAPAPPAPTPTPFAVRRSEPSTPTQGLTAAELLAMDDGIAYTAGEGVRRDVVESVARTVLQEEVTPAPREAASTGRRAAATPRPTPTPRPYRFRGWEEGVDGFEEIARLHDERFKPVVIYFHTDWCGWCRRLERDYFEDASFSHWLSRIDRVHINPEDGQGEADIARMFKVRGYPTFVVMAAGNSKYFRLHPFGQKGAHQSPEQFLADVQEAAKGP